MRIRAVKEEIRKLVDDSTYGLSRTRCRSLGTNPARPPAALSPGVQSQPPKTSSTPSTPNTMSFVGLLDDRPRAAESSRFPTEPFAAHERRLDIDDRTPLPRSKELKGPIVGGIIP